MIQVTSRLFHKTKYRNIQVPVGMLFVHRVDLLWNYYLAHKNTYESSK